MRVVLAYAIGLIFGLGITLSGMIDPAKVLNFFDIFGTWDPSLIFVMGGALAVALVGYRAVFGARTQPVLGDRYHLPTTGAIDRRLISGAAIFGLGWGIAGFCPGGALPAVGTLDAPVLVFMAALVAGMLATRWAIGLRATAAPAKRADAAYSKASS